MFFTHELIDALKNNVLHLDCPEMELTQEGTTTPKVINGLGYIRQESDGRLVFKLYSSKAVSDLSYELADPFTDLIPGQLLPATQYHSLRSTNRWGRVWTAKRIWPDIHCGQIKDGRQAFIVSGALRDIECLDEHAGKSSGQELTISFFEEIALPYTQATLTEKRVGDNVARGFHRNAALFRAAEFDCRVTSEDGTTTIVIATDGRLPSWLEVRVIEAFQFILAQTVWPRVIRKYDSGSEAIRFTSALRSSGKARMKQPIEHGTMEDLVWTWVLFDK